LPNGNSTVTPNGNRCLDMLVYVKCCLNSRQCSLTVSVMSVWCLSTSLSSSVRFVTGGNDVMSVEWEDRARFEFSKAQYCHYKEHILRVIHQTIKTNEYQSNMTYILGTECSCVFQLSSGNRREDKKLKPL